MSTIEDQIFDETTGIYTCTICFAHGVSSKSELESSIKKHILSLNYKDFVFNPNLGSKVSASRDVDNKNVRLEVQLIEVQFV